MDKLLWLFLVLLVALFTSCAGERQGLVCEEIEYRLNTQTYSPDQRAYIEEELRVCREEESQKKGDDARTRQNIYDRFAASDTTKSSAREVSVSEALKDSSGQETVSIRDRYNNVSSDSAKATDSADSSKMAEPAELGDFQ